MEEGFPWQETPDQLTAIEAVKWDMEQALPTDRLICGDVGYGKTEVAIRAAFKAVMDGKQVAVLVPTTVLASQHYRTFSERMAAFPIRVELLSRTVPRKEQTRIVAASAEGAVDMLIGTHRLLSQDVKFKDLGLVIVDEEQRFGVKQKERFKAVESQRGHHHHVRHPHPAHAAHGALRPARDVAHQYPAGRPHAGAHAGDGGG